jgi:hypothetical protein
LVTIAVSNLDEHAPALAARGLALDERGADSSNLRQLTITDDDGVSRRSRPTSRGGRWIEAHVLARIQGGDE